MTSWRDEVMGVKKPTAEDEDDEANGNESEVANYASSSPAPPTRPPSSPGVSSGPDEEDSLIREAERDAAERREEAAKIPAMDEEEEFWREDSEPSSIPDFEDEAWAAMDDVEVESSVHPPLEKHINEDVEMEDVAKQKEVVSIEAEPLPAQDPDDLYV